MKNGKKFLRRRGEEGQAIVLIALVMVALLAAVGLAIDGGDLFLRDRDTQNSADAAVMAAAFSYCTGGDYEAVGLELARLNGHEEGVAETGYRTESVTVEIVEDAALNNFEAASAVIRVTETVWMPSYFIQVIYAGDKLVTNIAEWRCTPERVSPALHALSETCSYALNTNVSNGQIIGDIASNGGMNTSSGSMAVNGTGFYLGTNNLQNTTWEAQPTVMDSPLEYREDFELADFAPGGRFADDAGAAGQYFYINGNLQVNPHESMPYGDGLYYVTGTVSIRGDVTANVTIVAQGTIRIDVTDVTMTAYTGYDDDKYPQGLLLYSAETTTCGSNAITVAASTSQLNGMIISPNGGMNISASDSQVYGGIVAQTIDLHGSNLVVARQPVRLSPTLSGVR